MSERRWLFETFFSGLACTSRAQVSEESGRLEAKSQVQRQTVRCEFLGQGAKTPVAIAELKSVA